MPNLEWHFTLLDDPVVNAFALPGGYVYVTRGIMAHMNNEAAMAGVLGHELGHVTARHSAQQMTNQQLAGLGLGVAGVFSTTVQRYGQLASQGLQLMFLKYGRDHENQSDELGVQYSTAAGWDAREMVGTYQTLGRVSARSGQALPSFLSTHPDPGNREVHVRELAAQATAGKTNLIVGARKYLSMINGIVYGQDPRKGYFEGTHFYHPPLDLEMQFPSGWQVQNTHAAVMAGLSQKGVMQLTVANTGGQGPSAYIQALQKGGKITRAEGRSEQINGFDAWVGRIYTPAENGGEQSLIAALIQKGTNVFQILGQTAAPGDANESAILQSVRTFRPLADPARKNPTPDRLEVVTVSQPGTFAEVYGRAGTSAITPEEASVLNNRDLDDNVLKGEQIKVVRPGKRK
jgi:predicted Zn-dependent protease